MASNSKLYAHETASKTVPPNTKKSHNSIWKQFSRFCTERGHNLTADTPTETIVNVLQDWALNMKKENGEPYKEAVVKTMWNVVAKLLQTKYANDYNIRFDPFQDAVFKRAREARDAVRRELKDQPGLQTVSAMPFTHEEVHSIQEYWDEDTPEGLQKKLYHVISIDLAWGGNEAARAVVDHFCPELNGKGVPTGRIEYNPTFSGKQETKTIDGSCHPRFKSKWLVPNVANPSICPVRLFTKLLRKRPTHIESNRLFLTPNKHYDSESSSGWYKSVPVGRNLLAKWTRDTAERVGLDPTNRKITTRSNRITALAHICCRSDREYSVPTSTSFTSETDSSHPQAESDEDCFQELEDSNIHENEKLEDEDHLQRWRALNGKLTVQNSTAAGKWPMTSFLEIFDERVKLESTVQSGSSGMTPDASVHEDAIDSGDNEEEMSDTEEKYQIPQLSEAHTTSVGKVPATKESVNCSSRLSFAWDSKETKRKRDNRESEDFFQSGRERNSATVITHQMYSAGELFGLSVGRMIDSFSPGKQAVAKQKIQEIMTEMHFGDEPTAVKLCLQQFAVSGNP